MKIVEIIALENGAHRNQTGGVSTVPEGWAVVPDDMDTPNFPFGEIETEEINGVKTVTSWTPGTIPEADPEPTPDDSVDDNTDSVTWDVLAKAYSEGVNSID